MTSVKQKRMLKESSPCQFTLTRALEVVRLELLLAIPSIPQQEGRALGKEERSLCTEAVNCLQSHCVHTPSLLIAYIPCLFL